VEIAATIATIIAAATTTGVGIEQAMNQPSQPKLPTTTTPTPLTAGQNANQAAVVGQQPPGLQAMTGGSLSPEYFAQYSAGQAGVGNDPQATGNIQQAINQFFGLNAPGNTGLAGSGAGSTGGGGGGGILDLLSKPKPPGAGTESAPFGSDLVSSMLSGDAFKGLSVGA
jgi:hypothetical protein